MSAVTNSGACGWKKDAVIANGCAGLPTAAARSRAVAMLRRQSIVSFAIHWMRHQSSSSSSSSNSSAQTGFVVLKIHNNNGTVGQTNAQFRKRTWVSVDRVGMSTSTPFSLYSFMISAPMSGGESNLTVTTKQTQHASHVRTLSRASSAREADESSPARACSGTAKSGNLLHPGNIWPTTNGFCFLVVTGTAQVPLDIVK